MAVIFLLDLFRHPLNPVELRNDLPWELKRAVGFKWQIVAEQAKPSPAVVAEVSHDHPEGTKKVAQKQL